MICPNCGKNITAEQDVCAHCGQPTQFSSRIRYIPKAVPFAGASPVNPAAPQTSQRPAASQPFAAPQKSADGKAALEEKNRTIRKQRILIVILAIESAIAILLTCLFGVLSCRSCKDQGPNPEPKPMPTERIEPEPDPKQEPDPGSEPEQPDDPEQRPEHEPNPEMFLFGGVEIKSGSVAVSGIFTGINGTADHPRVITKSEIEDLVRLCPDLETLTLNHCILETCEPLSGLTKLKTLALSFCSADGDLHALSDIGWIRSLVHLTELDLSGNPISDFKPLVELKELEILRLHHTNVKEISFLAELKKLRLIHIGCGFDGNPMDEVTWDGKPVSWSEAIEYNRAIKAIAVEKKEDRIREDLKTALEEGKLDKLY